MISVVTYPFSFACSARSVYLAVFLCAASSKLVSKQTVSSAKHNDLHLSSNHTKSEISWGNVERESITIANVNS